MFKRFIAELRINKKLAQIFWMFFSFVVMLLFLVITWNVAANFNRGLNGFRLLRQGVTYLFVNEASKASQAYIISGAILGFFPMLLLLPILYFKSTSYLINFKIKPHFPHVVHFSRWSKMIHIAALALLFFSIGAILTTSNGGTLSHKKSFEILFWAFDGSDLSKHTAGIGMWLVYGGAIFPVSILVIWFLVLSFEMVFSSMNNYFKAKRENKLSNKQRKKNNENSDII